MSNELTENLKQKATEYNIKNYIQKQNEVHNGFSSNAGYMCVMCGNEAAQATVRWYKDKFTKWKVNELGAQEFESLDEKVFSEIKCYKCQEN